MKKQGQLATFLTTLAILLLSKAAFGQGWPHWRGPNANGISPETGLPVAWSPSDNIAWKVKLPGRGMSTPIVWGDRIFVTSQIGFGKVESRSARYEGPVMSDDGPVTFVIQCFRREDGKPLWEHRVPTEKPLPAVHAFHNLSTPSPVTDGERVYAWFGTGQIIALTLDGQAVWSRNLGKEYSPFQLQWGHGSSPVLHKENLFLLMRSRSSRLPARPGSAHRETGVESRSGQGPAVILHSVSRGSRESLRTDCQFQSTARRL